MIPVFMYIRDEEYNILQLYANYYKPSEIDLLWSIDDRTQLPLLLASFTHVYSYIDEYNILRYVPDYSTRTFHMPMTRIRKRAKGPLFILGDKEFKNSTTAIMSIIGWVHPNRYNILNRFEERVEFDITKLKFLRYRLGHNKAKTPVFRYLDDEIIGIPKLVEVYNVDPKEVKKKFRLIDRHEELIEKFELSKQLNRVHVGNSMKHPPMTFIDNVSQLRRFLEIEGDGVGDVMAKRIMKELKVL